MHLKDNHSNDKPVSSFAIFKGELGTATSLQILKDQRINEHVSKVPALLICVVGEVLFENEKGISETLLSGDFINIEGLVIHWLVGKSDCQVILLK
ncbi:MAG: hypothetical protein WAU21_14880 [Chitinophagales bacterium]|nr:hypothetical protein [Bacteroidota bacterium]MBK8488035.1 hypothetical protein [Bacteroidota bacterium]MBK8682209.1 hypothetical protein [Bacteroidota bacterium]MBP9703319.1 hypothetical protein [Chitinophagales bacterium]